MIVDSTTAIRPIDIAHIVLLSIILVLVVLRMWLGRTR